MIVPPELLRIRAALDAAVEILRGLPRDTLAVKHKPGGDPVTQADLAVDAALRAMLPRDGEGWLSEESEDDSARLACRRVWVVDPIDGTRQLVDGIPEWCVSVALVEDGEAIAGGICNPASGEIFVGHRDCGVLRNGQPARVSAQISPAGAVVLASRSETGRGEWDAFRTAPFTTRPTGSVAYKLGLVAVGLADATFSFVEKHEWDVAAGVALVRAAGGSVTALGCGTLAFNRPSARVPGLLAAPVPLARALEDYLRDRSRSEAR